MRRSIADSRPPQKTHAKGAAELRYVAATRLPLNRIVVAADIDQMPGRPRGFLKPLVRQKQAAVGVVAIHQLRGVLANRLKYRVLAVADHQHVKDAGQLVECRNPPPLQVLLALPPRCRMDQRNVRPAENQLYAMLGLPERFGDFDGSGDLGGCRRDAEDGGGCRRGVRPHHVQVVVHTR